MFRMSRVAMVVLLSALLFCVAASAADAPGAVPAAEEGHHSTGEKIATVLRRAGLPDGAVVFLISTLPIVELRGSIPVGINVFKMNPVLVYFLSVAGNMVPVPFILLLLGPVSQFCMRFKIGRIFFDWLFTRTRRKGADIEKYETLGLTIFVAIPLPATGAWTGAMAAFLLGMQFHHAMLSALFGVLIAGVIMTTLSLMGWMGAAIAGIVLIAMVFGGMARWLKKEEQKGGAGATGG